MSSQEAQFSVKKIIVYRIRNADRTFITKNHPVRDSNGELVSGPLLWDNPPSSDYEDNQDNFLGKFRGSFRPYVYAYRFGSVIANSSVLKVTVELLDQTLVDKPVTLIGTLGVAKIFESNAVVFKSTGSIGRLKIDAPYIRHDTKTTPFAVRGDVVWTMKSEDQAEEVPAGTTRLELYWITDTLHDAFIPYIPVKFLRSVIRGATADPIKFYKEMTRVVFNFPGKRYNTNGGASTFDVNGHGGNFRLDLYLGDQDTSVNCFDQAAMLQLCFSLHDKTNNSWLLQQPFGFIKATNLVGIKDDDGNLIEVDHPFFGDDMTKARGTEGIRVERDNNGEFKVVGGVRRPFGCHVYNGYPKWVPEKTDRRNDETKIYDACAGPYRGTGNIVGYLGEVIDRQRHLYVQSRTVSGYSYDVNSEYRDKSTKTRVIYGVKGPSTSVNFTPAPAPAIHNLISADALGETTSDIHTEQPTATESESDDSLKLDVRTGTGVIGINMITPGLQVRRMLPPKEPLSPLVAAVAKNTVSYTGWARLPTWLGATLGDTWKVEYERVTVSEDQTQGLWYISDADTPGSRICVHVLVASPADKDGYLDLKESGLIVTDRVHSIITSTQRDGIWEPRTLPDNLGESLQYIDGMAAGRVVVAARNVAIDIEGMNSRKDLECKALLLLDHAVKDSKSPEVPELPLVPTLEGPKADTKLITMADIDTRFSVVLSVKWEIATAGANSDGTGVLFDRYVESGGKDEKGLRTVEFFFIARELGVHHVHMYVADKKTMLQAKSALEVKVVEEVST